MIYCKPKKTHDFMKGSQEKPMSRRIGVWEAESVSPEWGAVPNDLKLRI